MTPPPALPTRDEDSAHSAKIWTLWLLTAIQLLICAIIFLDFISGKRLLAYADIGSDTFFSFVPSMIHWANYVRESGWPGWSFNIGLGGPVMVSWDPFTLINLMAGSDQVVALRPWLTIAKLMLAGAIFFAFLIALSIDRRAAVIGGVIYSFCGYAQVDAQWDPMALELIFYPLLLLALVKRLQGGGPLLLIGAVALAIVSNVFFVSFCVFTALAFGASIALAEKKRQYALLWFSKVAPPFLIGMGLAAPVMIPFILQMFDSPRVSGGQALFAQRLAEFFSINDSATILAQLAGLFHKNMLGIGSFYSGWMNYLEGPGFYIGTTALLLIPQLWTGDRHQRRILAIGLVALILYIAFPAIRYAAFGFAVPYFRVSTLWVSIMLLTISALAFSLVLRRGPGLYPLIVGSLFCLLTPVVLRNFIPVFNQHFIAWTLFAASSSIILFAARLGLLPLRWLAWFLLAITVADLAWTGYQSANTHRLTVTAQSHNYKDLSQQAILKIQEMDAGFYRIEKNYSSVADNDALVQNYFGVQSYSVFHSNSTVRFFIEMGLIPASNPQAVNYTNWLPDFGNRFPLYSLVGVKYFLSRDPVTWPGFSEIGRIGSVRAYGNRLALPLAVLHTRQVDEADFLRLSLPLRERMLFDSAITETSRTSVPRTDPRTVIAQEVFSSDEDWYVSRVEQLQRSGLKISSFEQNRVVGEISAAQSGILVYSIPFNTGWSALVDGKPTPTFRANLGFTGVEVGPGKHRVELSFRAPGLFTGWVLVFFALTWGLALGFLGKIKIRPTDHDRDSLTGHRA